MKSRFFLAVLIILFIGGVYGAGLVDKSFLEDKNDPNYELYSGLDKIAKEQDISINYKIQNDGTKIIEDDKGNVIGRVPLGYRLNYAEDELRVSGKSSKDLSLFGFDVSSDQDVSLSLTFNEDGKEIRLNQGVADVKVGGRTLKGVTRTSEFISPGVPIQYEDAVVRVNKDDEIVYARFKSAKGGSYSFTYSGRNYVFDVGEGGGTVLFDPANNVVSGEDVDIDYSHIDSEGRISRQIFSGEKVEIKLNSEGNVVEIVITDGVFDGEFFGGNQIFSSEGEFTIFLDGRDISDFDGNAISIDEGNRKINIHGELSARNLKGSLSYRGISKDAYAEFYFDGAKKDGVPYIDVKTGFAEIDNRKHLIQIVNGNAKLRIKNGDLDSATGFRFRSGILEGYVDEENGLYHLISTRSSGDYTTTSVPLNTYKELSSNNLIAQQLRAEQIESEVRSNLASIRSNIDSGEFEGRDLQALKHLELVNQYRIDIIEGNDLDQSIARANALLGEKLDPKIEIATRGLLAEMRLQNAQGLDAEGAGLNYLYSRNSYSRNIERIGELENAARRDLSSDALDRELRSLRELRVQSEMGLLRAYMLDERDQYVDSRGETISLAFSREKFLKSYNPTDPEGIRLKALAENRYIYPNDFLERSNGLRRTLVSLRDAELSGGGDQATASRVQFELSLIDNRLRQYGAEGGRLLDDIYGIIGDESEEIWYNKMQRPITEIRHFLSSDRLDQIAGQQAVFLDEDEQGFSLIDRRRIGLSGMRDLVASGVDMKDYFASDNLGRLHRIIDIGGFDDYVTAQQFRDYSDRLGLTFENSRIDSDTRRLFAAISQDRGDAIGSRFSRDFSSAVLRMDMIDRAVSNDPVIWNIAGHGSDIGVEYTGDIPLVGAFGLDRVGNPIEKSAGDYILQGADFATVLAAPAGAGRILAGGAKLLRAERALEVVRAGLTSETLFTSYLGEGLSATAYGAITDTALVLSASAALSEDTAGFIDTVSMLGAVPSAARGIKAGLKSIGVVEDALGNRQALGIVDRQLFDELRKSGNFRALDNGILLGKNGERFAVEVPAGLREVDIAPANRVLSEDALRRFNRYASSNDLPVYQRRDIFVESDNEILADDRLWVDPSTGRTVPLNERSESLLFELESRRNPLTTGEVSSRLDKNGLFLENGRPANGRYMWTIDESGEFNFRKLEGLEVGRSSRDFPHSFLSRGNGVRGAGEVEITDGRFNLHVVDENGRAIGSRTGHFLDGSDPNFDENVLEAFNERARGLGWRPVSGDSPVSHSVSSTLDQQSQQIRQRASNVAGINPVHRQMGDLVGTGSAADEAIIAEFGPGVRFARNRGLEDAQRGVAVFDTSGGKNPDVERFYRIDNVDGLFGNTPNINLASFRQEVGELAGDPDLLEIVQTTYGPRLLRSYELADDNQRRIMAQFMDAIGVEVPSVNTAVTLSRRDKESLKAAFKGGWSGSFSRKQVKELERFGLGARKTGGGHIEIFRSSDGSQVYTTSSTPGDNRGPLNMVQDLISQLERS